MGKQIPDPPPNWNPPRPSEGHSYEIELITPMVGGGAAAGVVDLDYPIRATAIRGQLRYWWRLVRGHSLGERMWRREEEIFGSTEFPSPVTVIVTPGAKKPKHYPINKIKPTSTHGYVLFPAIDKGHDLLEHGYQFRLTLSIISSDELRRRRDGQNRKRKPTEQLPAEIAPIEEDVLAAMRVWVLFGGIGARTRRGCGALRVIKEPEPLLASQPDQLLKRTLREMPAVVQVFQARSPVPHLEAWERVIGLLKSFRQPPPARRGEPRRKFPEAETLRRITGVRGHRNRPIPVSDMPSGFPRAELGLPIVFQFKDGSGPDGQTALPHGNDSDGKPLQRMGSPVILKPIPVSPTHSLPTIIVLHRPKNLTVDVASATDQPVVGAQFAGYPNSPLAGTSGSAIEAFIKFTGFTEVKRS
jgi:CRISPR-associated protein Cmr1